MLNDGSYNLEEIWQFPINGGGRGHFGQSLGQFGDSNGDVSGNDPVNSEQIGGNGGGGGARKRRDAEDDLTPKGNANANANANGVVFVFWFVDSLNLIF